MLYTKLPSLYSELLIQNNSRNTPRRMLAFRVEAELPIQTRYLFHTKKLDIGKITIDTISTMLGKTCKVTAVEDTVFAWKNPMSILRIIDDSNNLCLVALVGH